MTTKPILETLAYIQSELKSPKGQHNSFGNYNYRSCEDILNALKPLLKETNTAIVISDEIVLIGDRYYVKAIATLLNGPQSHSATAYARESLDKKGMDSAQITGATSSYARKYALNGLLAIDDSKDADTQDNTLKSDPIEIKKAVESVGGTVVNNIPKVHCVKCNAEISSKVYNYSMDKYKEPLCFDHQPKK